MKKILTLGLLVFPAIANAQADLESWGYNDFSGGAAGQIALGSRDFRSTIGGVINIILGFLGILTTVAIIFGGFKMMTSYGNAEKNSEGKSVVIAGAVGLIIVLTAYAISRYVLSELFTATSN